MSVLKGRAVLVAAGGTGGHMTPALAVAAELRARGASVTFATTPSQVARVGAEFPAYSLEMRGFERRPLARENARAVRLLVAAVPGAWRIVSRVRPTVAVGGGGYVSGPVVALAAARRVPAVVLENDSHLGVTNRLLAPLTRRVCLSFPIAGLEAPKYVVTGRALAAAQLAASAADGRAAFGLSADLPVVLAFGGSQGAQSINRACLEAFARPGLDFQFVHVCGERNEDETWRELVARGAPLERYKLVAYTDRLAAAMAAADLVIGRSGGSIAEITALGRPAILVPYPYASADHQRKNARWMAAGGGAVVIEDAELAGPRLRSLVAELLDDRERLARMGGASRALGKPEATARIADEIERLIGNER